MFEKIILKKKKLKRRKQMHKHLPSMQRSEPIAMHFKIFLTQMFVFVDHFIVHFWEVNVYLWTGFIHDSCKYM